jgi:hypothetical protein
MRQSRKEATIERMARQGLPAERREALAFPGADDTEAGADWAGGPRIGSVGERRGTPGGRRPGEP